jgi:hypothetical protein
MESRSAQLRYRVAGCMLPLHAILLTAGFSFATPSSVLQTWIRRCRIRSDPFFWEFDEPFILERSALMALPLCSECTAKLIQFFSGRPLLNDFSAVMPCGNR